MAHENSVILELHYTIQARNATTFLRRGRGEIGAELQISRLRSKEKENMVSVF